MWLQVLTVPFYAWSQASGLPERAAYLDVLLSSRCSHLATSQAAGLEPLFCVPGLRISPAMLPRCDLDFQGFSGLSLYRILS